MKRIFHFRTYFRSKTANYPTFLFVVYLCVSCGTNPEKRPSPLRYDSASIRGAEASIYFSSPAVKNRKIFGLGEEYLVPYSKLWRTGANSATFISISAPMIVGDSKLDSGKYALFTIPDQSIWTIILNKEWDQWGSYNYKDSLDVLRLKVRSHLADQVQERMLFYFADDSLKFRWENVRWAVPFTTAP